MGQETIARFIHQFEHVSGHAYCAGNVDAFRRQLTTIIEQYRPNSLATGDLPPSLSKIVSECCEQLEVAYWAPPYRRADLPGLIDSAGIGVGFVQHAIAETGTLIELTTNDASRLVSSLPRVYVGIVLAKDIVAAYYDCARSVSTAFSSNAANCVVSFISGPSRTGDIELKLTLGVHGPEEAHAIIVDFDI